MKKPQYKTYYVIGFTDQLAKSGIVLDCFNSTGDGLRGFENMKMEMAKAAAAGHKFHGIDLPAKGFDAIRLVKVVK